MLYSLGEIDKDNSTAIAVLVGLISNSQDEVICEQAIFSLGAIAKDNTTAIAILLELVSTSKDEYIPGLAASSLVKIAQDIAIAKAVRTRNVRYAQWHLVNNQNGLVFCGFDFLTKTNISQSC